MITNLLENPCTWVTTRSTVKSVTKVFISWGEKTKLAKKKQPVKTLFLPESVVSKQLLGCSGHFLHILCHCNWTAHTVTCTFHVQLQRIASNVAFLKKFILWYGTYQIFHTFLLQGYFNLKSLKTCTVNVYGKTCTAQQILEFFAVLFVAFMWKLYMWKIGCSRFLLIYTQFF